MEHPLNFAKGQSSKLLNEGIYFCDVDKTETRPHFFEFRVLTLFPDRLEAFFVNSILGKARSKGILKTKFIQIRDYASDRHMTVDDRPFGGGPGMILRVDTLYKAWEENYIEGFKTILMSPQGKLWNQKFANQLSNVNGQFLIVCGQYEGIDQRFIELCVDLEVSVGDFILSGGEIPALILMDSIARLIPGVLSNEESKRKDTFEKGLKHPQYTKPREFMGYKVPEVLFSGNHKNISDWRAKKSLETTELKRPDLLT